MKGLFISSLIVLSSTALIGCEQVPVTCMMTGPDGKPITIEGTCYGSETEEAEEAEEQKAFEAACERATNYNCKGVKPPEVATEE
jgi:hypothetical protein